MTGLQLNSTARTAKLNTRTHLAKLGSQCRAKIFQRVDNIDVILTADPLHVGYATGYRSALLDANRTYRIAAILRRDGVALITGASDAAAALEVLDEPGAIYRHGSFFVFSQPGVAGYEAMPPAAPDFLAAVQAAIANLPAKNLVVGLDAVDEFTFAQITSLLSEHKVVDVRPQIITARSTKLPEEIAKIEGAAKSTERGLSTALALVKNGITERELGAVISQQIISDGGIPRLIVVAAGERASRVDAYATDQRIEPGMMIRFDLHASFDGYWADLARTAFHGDPPRDIRNRYSALLMGQQEMLDMAKVGVPVASLFQTAVETVQQNGVPHYERNHCGHGIGLTSHEFPTVMRGNETPLEQNMTFCFETPYYELGWGGMMVEDMIVITANGHRRLTQSDRSLIVIP